MFQIIQNKINFIEFYKSNNSPEILLPMKIQTETKN